MTNALSSPEQYEWTLAYLAWCVSDDLQTTQKPVYAVNLLDTQPLMVGPATKEVVQTMVDRSMLKQMTKGLIGEEWDT